MMIRFTNLDSHWSLPSSATCLVALALATACQLDAASLGDGLVQSSSAGSTTGDDEDDTANAATGGNAGTGPATPVDNPTGDCTAADFDENENAYWLPDCQNPLDHEFYRVYAASSESANTLPRVDGAPGLAEPCSTSAHPLSPIVERYGLCEPADTEEEVDTVNDMRPADALAVTHYLNSILVFDANPSGSTGVRPSVNQDHEAAACAVLPETRSEELVAYCDQTEYLRQTGWAMAPLPLVGRPAAELAGRLNIYYGIGPDCGDELPLSVVTSCDAPGEEPKTEVKCTTPCEEDADCAEAEAGRYCLGYSCTAIESCD